MEHIIKNKLNLVLKHFVFEIKILTFMISLLWSATVQSSLN